MPNNLFFKFNKNIIFLALCISLNLAARQKQFALVVDAGSSGSRIHLMQYDKNKNSKLPQIKIIDHAKQKPGIATLGDQPESIKIYLAKLIDSVMEDFEIKASSIPIIFHITAGARLLETKKKINLTNQIEAFLKTSGFTQHDVKILSGAQEGYYAWLSINYLYGTLEGPTSKLVNIIELGGASAQIVGISENLEFHSNGYYFDDMKSIHHVYAKSFLGLGNDEAHKNWQIKECNVGRLTNHGHMSFDLTSKCRSRVRDKLFRALLYTIKNLEGPYVALGYYHHLFEELDITRYDVEDLKRTQKFLCSHSKQEIAEEFPLLKGNSLEKACFDLIFAEELLIALGEKNPDLIKIHDSNKKYYTWAYGSLLKYLYAQKLSS